jgi:hypothetical protein
MFHYFGEKSTIELAMLNRWVAWHLKGLEGPPWFLRQNFGPYGDR